ncbi:MAG: hypothetical protein E3K38_13570 [Candidatus Kuenenia stuttgartiensis]|nr:hypothetical protein [Candidatus Kuenenia stuttgartiensis]
MAAAYKLIKKEVDENVQKGKTPFTLRFAEESDKTEIPVSTKYPQIFDDRTTIEVTGSPPRAEGFSDG